GASNEELLGERYSPVPGYCDAHLLASAIDEIAHGSFKTREPPEIQGTGYVVKSLEAAPWAFHRTSDFRSGCLAAVNPGDNADTRGAVYGQLAGAFYGASGIPVECSTGSRCARRSRSWLRGSSSWPGSTGWHDGRALLRSQAPPRWPTPPDPSPPHRDLL